jgi:hypothetical protein
MRDAQHALRVQLLNLFTKDQAHVSFEEAVKGIDYKTAGLSEKNFPYTIWQLSSHIWFTQKDILDFCINSDYKEPKWPDDYWPSGQVPTPNEWQDCLLRYAEDKKAFINLIKEKDLLSPIPHGTGQNLLREALLTCTHTSYHTGQILLLRKLLGRW